VYDVAACLPSSPVLIGACCVGRMQTQGAPVTEEQLKHTIQNCLEQSDEDLRTDTVTKLTEGVLQLWARATASSGRPVGQSTPGRGERPVPSGSTGNAPAPTPEPASAPASAPAAAAVSGQAAEQPQLVRAL
jgi:hypothetical protein